jgi:hypothetical protein
MQRDTFNFFLYRLNKEYRNDLFSSRDVSKHSDDEWLSDYLNAVCISEYDFDRETNRASYTWSLRNFQKLDKKFSSLVLARSQLQRTSTIVTDDSLIVGDSVSNPPPADTIILLIYWPRHIVIVENRAGMTTGETWLRNFHAIVDNAKSYIDIPVAPRLEPIPVRGTILEQLKSLDKVFRFRVRLKLPNPELNRWSKNIYDEMIEQRLTEYLQEFISPNGIRVDENSKAYSSAALAELGYKEGGVQIEGQQNGEVVQIDEGKTAVKGKIDQLRSLIRGLETNATGKQLKNALVRIESEVNRLFPSNEN